MLSQTLFGQSHTPRARLDLSPNTHSHKKFWHQNSRSVMQLWAYAAVIQETFPGTFSSQLFQIFKLDKCFWNHFAFDSLCMVCGSAKRLHLFHNWNRLDLEKLRESTIAYCLIWACVTFSPPLPEESPLWKDSSGNWWVQMWKYFTTLLALSKESLCHLLLVIIPGWGIGGVGVSWSKHDVIVHFLRLSILIALFFVGGGSMKLHWVKPPIHLGSPQHRGGASLHLLWACLQLGETLHCYMLTAAKAGKCNEAKESPWNLLLAWSCDQSV